MADGVWPQRLEVLLVGYPVEPPDFVENFGRVFDEADFAVTLQKHVGYAPGVFGFVVMERDFWGFDYGFARLDRHFDTKH